MAVVELNTILCDKRQDSRVWLMFLSNGVFSLLKLNKSVRVHLFYEICFNFFIEVFKAALEEIVRRSLNASPFLDPLWNVSLCVQKCVYRNVSVALK